MLEQMEGGQCYVAERFVFFLYTFFIMVLFFCTNMNTPPNTQKLVFIKNNEIKKEIIKTKDKLYKTRRWE